MFLLFSICLSNADGQRNPAVESERMLHYQNAINSLEQKRKQHNSTNLTESELFDLQQRVYEWPLHKKVTFLTGEEIHQSDATEDIVRKALRAELLREYSQTLQVSSDRIDSIRNEMERIRPYILELSDSDQPDDLAYAIVFGRYLHIDQPVASMFYEVLDKSAQSDKSNVTTALDAIFAYDLQAEDLKAALIEGLSVDNSIAINARYSRAAELWAGSWGFQEALNPLMDLVEAQYDSNGTINRSALKSIKEFGPNAESVYPRLKSFLERVKRDGKGDFREIESIEFALISIDPLRFKKPNHIEDNAEDKNRIRTTASESITEDTTNRDGMQTQTAKDGARWPIYAGVIIVVLLAGLTIWNRSRK